MHFRAENGLLVVKALVTLCRLQGMAVWYNFLCFLILGDSTIFFGNLGVCLKNSRRVHLVLFDHWMDALARLFVNNRDIHVETMIFMS